MNDAERSRLTDDLRFTLEIKPREAGWRPLVAIGAYCLMPNHFHLYMTPLAENGISKFMQRIQTGYTMYFNEKRKRTGALLQGTFKAEHVTNDNQAKYLFSYIHLNPAKIQNPKWKELEIKDSKKIREFVRTYPYSSYAEYATKSSQVTDPSKFPGYLHSTKDVTIHLDDWLHLEV